MISVCYWTRNEEYKYADELKENWTYQLNMNPVDSWDSLELIEETLKGVEYLSSWIGNNIQWRIEQSRHSYFKTREHYDDLKIIEH